MAVDYETFLILFTSQECAELRIVLEITYSMKRKNPFVKQILHGFLPVTIHT